MLSKGKTAIDGVSGNASGVEALVPTGRATRRVSRRTEKTRTGRAMFFISCSPRSSSLYDSLSRI
jgi:hypothetical protein